jgi:hypothetical protein
MAAIQANAPRAADQGSAPERPSRSRSKPQIAMADIAEKLDRIDRRLDVMMGGYDGGDRDPSIDAFCRRKGISRSHFDNEARAGRGPKVLAIGRRRIITLASELEWERVAAERAENDAKLRAEEFARRQAGQDAAHTS